MTDGSEIGSSQVPRPVGEPLPSESPFALPPDGAELPEGFDPNDSPFPVPPIEGLPIPKDSEEARAIRQILEQADREEAERSGD